MSFFIHLMAAMTAFVPFGFVGFLLVFFPGGKKAWTIAVALALSLLGIALSFLVPEMARAGAAVGALAGAVTGAVAARLSIPEHRR